MTINQLARKPLAKRLSSVAGSPLAHVNEGPAVSVVEPSERRATDEDSNSSQSSPQFHPAIQPENTLTGLQKYLLRVILLQAGETVFHRGRIVEVVDTHDSLRLLMPLVEPDLSEGNYTQAFWAPTRPADRQQFKLDRRNKSRRHQSIGISSGEGRPNGARQVRLRTRFPSTRYLTYLVKDLGYAGCAAFAAMVQAHQPWLRSVDRRRGTGPHQYSPIVCVMHPYVPAAPSRRTHVGGGLTEERVLEGFRHMRTDPKMKAALMEIVFRRRSTLLVADEFGLKAEILYVYASRLRSHIRAGAGADLHAQEKAA
jgi:hypothetical protein